LKASKSYVDNSIALKANLASPSFTGSPVAPTAISTDSSTILATTAFVKGGLASKASIAYVDNAKALMAPLASPALTGTPTAPTATAGTNTTQVATTAFVKAAVDAAVTGNGVTQDANDNSTNLATTEYVDRADALKANLASPTFTGTPSMPTGTTGVTQASTDNSTKLATTAFVTTAVTAKANVDSPTFSGTVAAPTATATDSTTKVATTAFVKVAIKRSNIKKGVVFNTSNSNATITVNQMLVDGMYNFNPTSGSRTLTTPTAAELISGIASTGLGTAEVGDTFSVVFINGNASNSYTVTFGTGITYLGGGTTRSVSNASTRTVYFRITNITSGSQAITVY
jgi:hypothetical protein